MDEVHLGPRSFGDFGMYCILLPVVLSDAPAQESPHVADDASGDMVGPLWSSRETARLHVVRLACDAVQHVRV
jgi:hypothetical protein